MAPSASRLLAAACLLSAAMQATGVGPPSPLGVAAHPAPVSGPGSLTADAQPAPTTGSAGPLPSAASDGTDAPAWISTLDPDADGGGSRLAARDATDPAPGVLGTLRDLIEAGRAEPEFLHPDAAFRVDASAPEPAVAVVRWRIEPGYYLYRKRIEAALGDGSPDGTSIAGLDLPPGEVRDDPYFGRVQVFRSEAAATVRLRHAGPPPPALDLAVVYQGCADAGLCYPPIRKVVAIRLDGSGAGPPAGAGAVTPGGSAAPGAGPAAPAGSGGAPGAAFSETDRIAHFLRTDGLGESLAVFFGFGLLLSFTPCIFPMIPILSSILVADGRTGRTRGLRLSLAYVSGSALTWATAGGIAGLLGANVQAALQNPWALGAVSAAFVALAASMFGLFRFELPNAWTTRAAGWTNRAGGAGGHAGAAAMGLVSALVVGPCVAAPMAGAVLYIGHAGDALRGGLALFAMGFGMGVPLLVLGASSGRLLPRVGPWMDAVQQAAGVVLLGVAAYLLERVFPTWAVMAGWAVVAAAAGVVLARAVRRQSPRGSIGRGLRYAGGGAAVAAAVYAVALLTGAATGAQDPLRPLAGLRSAADPGRIEFITIKGLDGPGGLEAALARAAASSRFVMLDFYADWCVSCKEMEESTFGDPRVRAALDGVELLRADVTRNDTADRALLKRLGVLGPPAILFFGPDRQERRRYRTVGFKDPEEFTSRVTGATGAA